MEVEEETPPRHPHSRRERGYFTASPRQDRMTYFARLLLSRGASSAPLISNRKSRGEPRRTAGQSAAGPALLVHRRCPRGPREKKDRRPMGWDTMVSPDARFRGICIRASYPPRTTSNDAGRSSSRICNRVGSATCFVSSSSSSSFVLSRSLENSISRGMDSFLIT